MNDRSNVFLVGWKNDPGNICITEVPKKHVSWDDTGYLEGPGIPLEFIEDLGLIKYTMGEFFNYISIESSKDEVSLRDWKNYNLAQDAVEPSGDDNHSYVYDVRSGRLNKIYRDDIKLARTMFENIKNTGNPYAALNTEEES